MPHHPYTQALIRAIPDFGSAMPHKVASIRCPALSHCWNSYRLVVVWGHVARMHNENAL